MTLDEALRALHARAETLREREARGGPAAHRWRDARRRLDAGTARIVDAEQVAAQAAEAERLSEGW